MNTDERLIYNKDSVQKSLDLLNESNNEFRDAGVELRNAMDMLNEVKGNDLLKNIENLTNENTPKMLMTMCDENIGNTIYNINNGVEKVENYLVTGAELDLNPQSSGQRNSGQQQPVPPTQPSAPTEQLREQPTTGPNGEQPPSPPEQPSPPSEQQNSEQPTTGPNGEQPPSPPEQPSPPGEQQKGEQPTTGPNGEQPPSPPEQPSPLNEEPTNPQQQDMKKGSLVGALIGLGIGTTVTGGTTAAIMHYKKKNKDEKENEKSKFFEDL